MNTHSTAVGARTLSISPTVMCCVKTAYNEHMHMHASIIIACARVKEVTSRSRIGLCEPVLMTTDSGCRFSCNQSSKNMHNVLVKGHACMHYYYYRGTSILYIPGRKQVLARDYRQRHLEPLPSPPLPIHMLNMFALSCHTYAWCWQERPQSTTDVNKRSHSGPQQPSHLRINIKNTHRL